MAIYLTHQYGTRFYGPERDVFVGFDPEKFLAYSVDYSRVRVTWEVPDGDFDLFRLVKNRHGYPVSELDGEILFEDDTPDSFFVDADVTPGRFYYYGIFIRDDGVWSHAGNVSCLHIRDARSTEWLWERLPVHYRILRGNRLDLEADDNVTLLNFMRMFGWGLDHIRTSLAASLHRMDPYLTHIDVADILIEHYGLPIWPGQSAVRRRAILRDGAALLSQRGTKGAMLAAARAASGWDLTLRPSPNLMLSGDFAQMHNPVPAPWDSTRVYAVGDRVRLEGADYVCKVAGTSGYAQTPAGERTGNTWWDPLMVLDGATAAYDAATNSQHGWSGVSFTAGATDAKAKTELVLGAPMPADSALSVNAVTVKNTHSSTATVGARLLPVPVGQAVPPTTAITYGIPLPQPAPWSPAGAYDVGTVVTYQGKTYHAIRPSQAAVAPPSSGRWQRVSPDGRLRLIISAYTHQPHTSTAKPVRPARVFAEFYDDRGALLGREVANATDTRVFDSFTHYTGAANAGLAGRGSEYGGKTWASPVAGLLRDSYAFGTTHLDAAATTAQSTIDYGSANASVAATFRTDAPAGRVQALLLRHASATSYVRATRTKLQTVSGTTVTDLVTYGTPIADGDRLTVKVTGNAYTVLRNGVQVATTTSAFNNTATVFGIAVE